MSMKRMNKVNIWSIVNLFDRKPDCISCNFQSITSWIRLSIIRENTLVVAFRKAILLELSHIFLSPLFLYNLMRVVTLHSFTICSFFHTSVKNLKSHLITGSSQIFKLSLEFTSSLPVLSCTGIFYALLRPPLRRLMMENAAARSLFLIDYSISLHTSSQYSFWWCSVIILTIFCRRL